MTDVLIINPPSVFSKNVVRDLIYGCCCKGKRIGGTQSPPLNLLHIASVLKQENHRVTFLDALAEQRTIEETGDPARKNNVIIFSTTSMTFMEDIRFLCEIKKINPSIISIIFGSQPTFMPESTLKEDSVDIIVRREPEYIIRDLIRSLDNHDGSWKKVPGIGYKREGKIILNELYPLIEDLDELPFLMRELLPRNIAYFNPLVKEMPYTTMMTSRGCPGRCTFCTAPSFYGNKIRSRSVDNILSELEMIQQQGYREVWFRDETFTAFKKRNIDLCNGMLDRDIRLSWMCNARVGSVDREMLILMKKAGCHLIKFGVESGVQKILDNIGKGITVDQTRDIFRITRETGVDTHAHMMLGCPGETEQTIRTTLDFVKEIDPSTVSFGICTPYPGTDLFNQVASEHPEIRDGSACDLSRLHENSFFNEYFVQMSPDELGRWLTKAYFSYYFRFSYVLKTLKRIKSPGELKRVFLAGTNVFQFALDRD
jgi:anaerobic magnesium-protoporphyrin IX monomethyl ester cyclase